MIWFLSFRVVLIRLMEGDIPSFLESISGGITGGSNRSKKQARRGEISAWMNHEGLISIQR